MKYGLRTTIQLGVAVALFAAAGCGTSGQPAGDEAIQRAAPTSTLPEEQVVTADPTVPSTTVPPQRSIGENELGVFVCNSRDASVELRALDLDTGTLEQRWHASAASVPGGCAGLYSAIPAPFPVPTTDGRYLTWQGNTSNSTKVAIVDLDQPSGTVKTITSSMIQSFLASKKSKEFDSQSYASGWTVVDNSGSGSIYIGATSSDLKTTTGWSVSLEAFMSNGLDAATEVALGACTGGSTSSAYEPVIFSPQGDKCLRGSYAYPASEKPNYYNYDLGPCYEPGPSVWLDNDNSVIYRSRSWQDAAIVKYPAFYTCEQGSDLVSLTSGRPAAVAAKSSGDAVVISMNSDDGTDDVDLFFVDPRSGGEPTLLTTVELKDLEFLLVLSN